MNNVTVHCGARASRGGVGGGGGGVGAECGGVTWLAEGLLDASYSF